MRQWRFSGGSVARKGEKRTVAIFHKKLSGKGSNFRDEDINALGIQGLNCERIVIDFNYRFIPISSSFIETYFRIRALFAKTAVFLLIWLSHFTFFVFLYRR